MHAVLAYVAALRARLLLMYRLILSVLPGSRLEPSVEGLGTMTHAILKRVVARMKVGTNNNDQQDDTGMLDEVSDFKLYLGRKQNTSHTFLCDAETEKTLAVALAVTESTDHLSARLQHLDATSHGFGEVASSWGLVQSCLFSLSQLGASSPDPGVCRNRQLQELQERSVLLRQTLEHHFEGRHGGDVILSELDQMASTVGSQVWARLALLYKRCPFSLFGGVFDRRMALANLFATHLCCVDSEFGEQFRRRYAEWVLRWDSHKDLLASFLLDSHAHPSPFIPAHFIYYGREMEGVGCSLNRV
jgi:hypothetical protein